MATELALFDHTFEAGADLSAKQFHFVKLNTSGQVVVCSGATDKPIGVLQNKPNATGKAAQVRIVGITKVSSDANLAAGDLIGTSADGQADAKTPGTDVTEFICGQVLFDTSGAAGDLTKAAINCINIARAA